MGLGTAQRNISAAIVVVTQNFAGTDYAPIRAGGGNPGLVDPDADCKAVGREARGARGGDCASSEVTSNDLIE